MKTISAVALTSISTLVKMLSGLVINKFISIYVGPSGLAIIGQFQNISGIIQTIASAGLANGIVKYTAENNSRETLWSNALRITLGLSVVTGVVLVIFSFQLSAFFLHNADFYYVFIVFGLTVCFFSINQLLLAVITGLKRVRFFVFINIIQSLYSLFFTGALIYLFSLKGALIAMVTNQSVVFFILIYLLKNDKEIKLSSFLKPFDASCVSDLLKYSLMALVSAFSLPVSSLIIRNYIASNMSWGFAGYWQAVNYISSMYLLVITTVLSVYYLPRLSSLFDKELLLNEIVKNSVVIVPLTILGAIIIYLFQDWIVVLLFSKDFQAMLILLKYQLLGDIVKISACLLSYLMLAKAMTKVFVVTEVLSAISITILSIYFFDVFGFVGLSYAYLINNVMYFLVVSCVTAAYFFNKYNFMKGSVQDL